MKTASNPIRLLVTGGAGFIGSALIRHLIDETEASIINLDKLTYAGNLESLAAVASNPRYSFEHVDICDADEVRRVLTQHQPDALMHLAAESHVDRSIDGPGEFMQTNVVGTYTLLSEVTAYWRALDSGRRDAFRFHHLSTDEVYGSLGDTGYFTEQTPHAPNSPSSARKAASDHLVRAWHHTYDLPVVTTNCSNNYGPGQFPEKLIPLITLNALEGKPLPIYGAGDNVRDWLYVEDHARALWCVLTGGRVGETYNVGGNEERTNIDVVRTVCRILDELLPTADHAPHESLIAFVKDRPGHDMRYAIDAGKIEQELGWSPRETFDSGLPKTIEWYLANREWCARVQDGSYQRERFAVESGS